MAVEPLDILWTCGSIARFLRVGNDQVYALAKATDCPIRKANGRLYAFPAELREWLSDPERKAGVKNPKST